MNTYIKTCVICPHCNKKTNDSIDHLEIGDRFGTWYCVDCGGGYCGIANGTNTEIEKSERCFRKTLDLLVLPPNNKPIYFVLEGQDFGKLKKEKTHTDEDRKYFYEMHSCPTNWIGNTTMISENGNVDPHGFLKFVRYILQPEGIKKRAELNGAIICAFPEVVGGSNQFI